MKREVDVVLDLSYGDCGKGAISALLHRKNKYDAVMRVSGGSNAGHTIFFEGKKIITHIIPCGFLVKDSWSIIGNGCVLNVKKFFEEINYLKYLGFDTSRIKIAENCHIVTDEHIKEEQLESRIGTTKQGIGPCYRDKYSRVGILAKDIPELSEYTVDMFLFLKSFRTILIEGAQGFYLDIDYGDYPYVTSSSPTMSSVLSNYIPYSDIRNVYGVIKAYETYVGSKKFQNEKYNDIFEKIVELGQEYGATTGRKRQVNFLNVDNVIKAINITGKIDTLFITKTDILCDLSQYTHKAWTYITNSSCNEDKHVTLKNHDDYIFHIENLFFKHCDINDIQWRYSPYQGV